MRLALLFAILLLGAKTIHAAEPGSLFTDSMTVNEFRRTGLDKLTDDELNALNRWVLAHPEFFLPSADDVTDDQSEAEVSPSPKVVVVTREVEKKKPRLIESRITGLFTGWSGETVFPLDNGQVWKQRLKGKLRKELQNPAVTIKRNRFGFYIMELDGEGRRVGVKRVR